jgi:cytochrome c553
MTLIQRGETTMKTLLKTALVAIPLVVATGTTQAAGDASAGRAKAAVCAACHGPNGVSANPQWPNLAGQKDLYLIKQMKAFRDGTRVDPLMSAQAHATATSRTWPPISAASIKRPGRTKQALPARLGGPFVLSG